MLGDADEAADVTQNAFLKVLDRLDQYRPEFRFFSWVYRIAVNESIDRIERRGRQQPLLSDEVSPLPGPDDQADASLLARHVQRCLMTLDAKYRSVLVLKHYSEFSYRQIADTLDLPEKTVKSRLYTAREQMRERLEGSSLD
jgi:RNA polymerase sigma-70 factor (ECF subfamily)